jgi:membrane associated rhomboid family serine protease
MNQYLRPGSFQILPEIVKNLIIINILFFLAKITLANVYHYDLDDVLGMHYIGSEKFKPWQIVTYMFMHGNFGHIFFNMFAVWMFGSSLENYWGPKRFLTYYILTGFGAAFIHYGIVYYQLYPELKEIDSLIAKPELAAFADFFSEDRISQMNRDMMYHFRQNYMQLIQYRDAGENQKVTQAIVDVMSQYRTDMLNAPVIVGASGALFGLLLAFGMIFPNTLIYIYFAIPVKAKYFVIGYGLLELYSGLSNNMNDNVAHFAHLGGMLFGFILLKFWQKTDRNNFYRF